jgi:CMP/dCMP kinase
MKRIIIAIDGNSGCGKSTTAREVAKRLGYTYVDSGAMYRAVAKYFLDHQVNHLDDAAVEKALTGIEVSFKKSGDNGKSEILLNGESVEDAIRDMRVSEHVSKVSSVPAIRKAMVSEQRRMGLHRGVVMDGRDIGTVVYPDAELKVFLTAGLEVRAKRRQEELAQKGKTVLLEEIISNLSERDFADSTRKESPLRKAEGAIEIDTSDITIEDQVTRVMELAKTIIASN